MEVSKSINTREGCGLPPCPLALKGEVMKPDEILKILSDNGFDWWGNPRYIRYEFIDKTEDEVFYTE